ncbi:MAG: F-box and leucine-rich repeat protein 2/20 [Chthoniobacter sp.]|jgi:hypothetical protein|nr:F-box and leucine-rich repeat protein 2/20 [Chthoniobacter sp.]
MVVVVSLPLQDWPKLRRFSQLQHFNVAEEMAPEVTDEHIRAFSQLKFPQLRQISLAHCGKVTDSGLRSLSNIPSIEGLQLIGLAMTDQGLDILATRFPHLNGINVEGCRALTVAGFLSLTKSPTISSVTLSFDPFSQEQLENIITQVSNVSWWTISDPGKRLDRTSLRTLGDSRKVIIQISDANDSVTEITTTKHK